MNKKIEKNDTKSIINRRQMLVTSVGATIGAFVSAPAIISAKSKTFIVPYTEPLVVVPGGWGFLKRMFDFKNWFWRGVGAFLREVLNVQQYPQIQPYNQNQSYNGWQVPSDSPILEIPQQSQTYALSNAYPSSYQEVIASNQNGQRQVFALPPAGLIGAERFLNALRCSCRNLTTENLEGLLVPQKILSQSMPATVGSEYYGKYKTRYGTLEITQTPKQYQTSLPQSELMVEVVNDIGPQDIRSFTQSRPTMVRYAENDVFTN